ncbi:MAG: GAF domain-containing sensor histidine kinase [Chthoniobacterales bacterium]
MAATNNIQILEKARLATLRRTGLLDSPPEEFFDLLTALAAKALDVPVALISLVDANRQFFKSQCGLPADVAEARGSPLSHSFCQYVAAIGEPFVVEDARLHPLVRENGAVADLGVIAYAGMPLTTEDGHTLGSFCVIDSKPRRWTARELEILRDFARQTMSEIMLRLRVEKLDADIGALHASAQEREEKMRHLVHDLRTPLNAVLLGIDGLPIMGELNADQHSCVTLVRNNVEVLRELMHALMELGQQEVKPKTQLAPCRPHELIDRALDQVATLAAKAGVRLDSGTVLPAPPVVGESADLVRVLVNLIANGVKFTPRGGEVLVALKQEEVAGRRVIRFLVRDTGIGISESDHERIFREGVRLDPNADPYQSTGIGLAFCHRVVEEQGGRLRVESAPGEGSTFSFALPIAKAHA